MNASFILPRLRVRTAHTTAYVVTFCVVTTIVSALAALSLYFCRFDAGIPAIWPACAIPLALLLVRRPADWRYPCVVIAASTFGTFVAALGFGEPIAAAIGFGIANGVEVGTGCVMAWLPLGPRPRLRRVDGLLKLMLAIGLIAPATGALLRATYEVPAAQEQFVAVWRLWFASHALGDMIFTTSFIVALTGTRRPWRTPTSRLSATLALLICFILLWTIFSQNSVTGLFLLPLIFGFLGIIAGFDLTCLGVTALTLFALYRTAIGHGPIVTLDPTSVTARILILQALICASFLSSIPIALIFERRARLITELRNQNAAIISRTAQYKAAANIAADTILVTMQDGTILYASPAAERLIGIAGQALAGRSAFELIHPEDRLTIRKAMATLSTEMPEITAELRLRPDPDEPPVWAEVKTRIGERRPDLSVELVSVVRDISARRAEDERRTADLARLNLLANTDTLTGLANRRHFNHHLDQEWRRAQRDQQHIAIVLIDVDLFKAYNDSYGHPAGDEALRRLAAIVGLGAMRPSDLAARIGGEEFAVILPSTLLNGARAVAERIRDGVRDLQITHESLPAGVLSVSIGIDCVQPASPLSPTLFIDRADKALYRAKRQRGSIVIST